MLSSVILSAEIIAQRRCSAKELRGRYPADGRKPS
jgi:hypothetical protein